MSKPHFWKHTYLQLKPLAHPPMFMALICPLQEIPDDGGMAMPICHHLDGAKIF